MKNLFTIGEISKLFDINIKTLRYYDEIDLFKPVYIDERNGYRYYSTEQFEELNTIKYLKALGMSLKTIKSHLDVRNIDYILKLFENQKKTTEEKIKELEFIKQKIENRIKQISYSRQLNNLNVIQELKFEDRTVALLRQKIKSSIDLELSIRELENIANKKPSIFSGKVGVSISIGNLEKRMFNEYDSTFLLVEDENYDNKLIKILPKGTYICIRFNGTREDSPIYYDKLLTYIKEKEYTVLDDSIETTLIDYGLTTDKSMFVTEIQILIKRC